MKIGSLVRIQHFGDRYNGQVGIIMSVRRVVGFKDSYSVRIPTYRYEIGLYEEQCEVINENR